MRTEATTVDERRCASNKDESCRMFRSELFERLSHVAPWVPHVLFVPVIGVALWVAFRTQSVVAALLHVGVGLLLWTFVEYVVHRYIFHPPQWIEDDTRRICSGLGIGDPVMPALPTWRHKFYFLVHGVHHDYPNDSTRLVMPPSVSVPLALLFFAGFRASFGAAAPGLFGGFVLGYLVYDTIHFLTHHRATRTALGKYLKRRHFRHHYLESDRDYGVSSPLWDAAFGTLGGRRGPDAP